jgi:4-amino-4-deoxy-L-arabinose transferase-like glycosyltransferase
VTATPDLEVLTVIPEPRPTRARRRVRPGRPAWALPAQAGIGVLALVLYTWDLSRNGMGNSFYAAAVKSGSVSWKAFFFGSLDPGSFTTVDKPPASLWVQELSARVFGFSSWSILLPEALAGVASVLVLYHLVRQWAGESAAALSALAFALTPVAVVMFRFNNPDALLTLALLLAAWALWSALETASTGKMVACGALLGLAFLTKTLEAFIVLPAFGLVYLVAGKPGLRRRIVQLVWAGVALVVASSWWVAIVELWPKASRPYVGGSADNSELNLIFGYNGFARIFGSGGATPSGGAVSFAGAPGWLRMFNPDLGGQVSWLIPLAAVGLVAGLVLAGRAPRTDRLRAGYLLWGGWMVLDLVVFSDAKGIFHPYYTVALAPALAAVAGAGSVSAWTLGRRRRVLALLLPAMVVGTAVWSLALLDRSPHYDPWLTPAILTGVALAAFGLWAVLTGRARRAWLGVGAAACAVVVCVAGPAAYAVSTVSSTASGAIPAAGPSSASGFGALGPGGGAPGVRGVALPPGVGLPRNVATGGRSGVPGGFGGTATVSKALVRYLESHRGSATYLVAVTGSQGADGLIIATGQPVMAMGGFGGADPNPTLAQFERMVASGHVHYVLVAGGSSAAGIPRFPPGAGGSGLLFGSGPDGAGARPFAGPTGGGGSGRLGGGSATAVEGAGGAGRGTTQAIDQWVTQHGALVPASSYGGARGGEQLYSVS